MNVDHHWVLLSNSSFCLLIKRWLVLFWNHEKLKTYVWWKDVEIKTIFVHIANSLCCADVLDGLGTSWAVIDGLKELPPSVNPRWFKSSFVSRRKCVRNSQEGRAFSENSVDILVPWSIEGIRIWVVVEMNFEALYLSVVRHHENVAIKDQRVSSKFALKILPETSQNTREWRLNVRRVVLRRKQIYDKNLKSISLLAEWHISERLKSKASHNVLHSSWRATASN